MSSRQKTIFAAIAVVAVAIVLFAVLKPGDSDDDPATGTAAPANSATPATTGGQGTNDEEPGGRTAPPKVPTVVFKNGKPVGGVLGIEVKKGEPIRLRVRSDVADEVHVHGFDISRDVPAGGTVSFYFPADITGIYEAEMEHLGVQVAELQVNP
ncbi:MAG: hypothetical protein JJE10_09550 [Thermoleophilia bacterium]|nr:hypothetical protein [Thermoleophilia bacterium]